FVIAGGVLYVIARRGGAAPPTRRHWRSAALIGGLLLLAGNGSVVVAERTVPSGLAALVIASEPLWIALLESWQARRAPRGQRLVGLLMGVFGVGWLLGPGLHVNSGGFDLFGVSLLLLAAFAWAVGSLLTLRV